MSAQQSVGTKFFGWNRVLSTAMVKTNFDIPIKTYPLDLLEAKGTWVWPQSDVALINTLAFDSVIPAALP